MTGVQTCALPICDTFEPDLDQATLDALKREWLVQIEQLARSPDEMLAHPDVASLIYRWRDYSGGMDAPGGWLAEVIETAAGFGGIAAALMTVGTSQGWGDRVAARYESFDKESIDLLIGIDVVERRLGEIDASALAPDRAHAVEVLRTHKIGRAHV